MSDFLKICRVSRRDRFIENLLPFHPLLLFRSSVRRSLESPAQIHRIERARQRQACAVREAARPERQGDSRNGRESEIETAVPNGGTANACSLKCALNDVVGILESLLSRMEANEK